MSPLLRFRTASWNTPDGIVVTLSPLAGDLETLLDAVRCHHAYLAIAPGAAAERVLAVPGISVSAREDPRGTTVVVSAPDRDRAEELQRRFARRLCEATRPIHDGE